MRILLVNANEMWELDILLLLKGRAPVRACLLFGELQSGLKIQCCQKSVTTWKKMAFIFDVEIKVWCFSAFWTFSPICGSLCKNHSRGKCFYLSVALNCDFYVSCLLPLKNSIKLHCALQIAGSSAALWITCTQIQSFALS